ncbi:MULTISPECIES: FAD/NAD(P)-binding oxidoreductase [unclassified Streptomyces]|uniref:NAD(P)/FAD-dependent oxidoreductase n=1 Tax=unclassified Streptomyces TaxID=2593676 RepID=UPI000DB9DA87|nr:MULTISPECIES: FAD/NAD(P)-binding oxidoreductase [unclassified Streptomyces]MYT69145.1 FAD-dependent oxidoreductase [Streptomyces sp. SID8367]RAJ82657.1 pyridine nucleotide-disulfide oxidoreductase [Streptomyces sp. PsTaAH-137]
MSGDVLRRVVIVGNGIAGLTAADTLRETGFDGELTLVGDEPYPAYSRPALSKALLLDGAPMSTPTLPAGHGGRELLGARATGLDLDRRRVRLDDGTELPYDRVVLATGSRARRLSGSPAEHTVRGMDDALALRSRLAGRPSVVVVGGGPLGMELASGCLAAGCRVTLVSRGTPLTAQLGPYLAEVILDAARERGLTVVESGAAARLSPDGTQVVLDGGGTPDAEVIVTAVGEVPNTEWLAGTGLTVRDAVPVDGRGLARPEVAAVGDLAAFPTPYGPRRVPLWSSAIEQAKVAARALVLGEEAAPLDFLPYFWTEQFGVTLKAVGRLPVNGDPVFVEGGPGGGPALMRWSGPGGHGATVALNHRIPVPRLRRTHRAAA